MTSPGRVPRLMKNHQTLAFFLLTHTFSPALRHVPARFCGIGTNSVEDSLIEGAVLVLITIAFTWLYRRTGGTALATALLRPSLGGPLDDDPL